MSGICFCLKTLTFGKEYIDELRNDEKKLKNVFLVFDCLKLVFEC